MLLTNEQIMFACSVVTHFSSQIVCLLQEDSSEYQQAEALWELFCESKCRLNGDENDDDNEDDENSRLSSVTDVSRSTAAGGGDSLMECLKVPVLKLKVASYAESAVEPSDQAGSSSVVTPSNECSSDFDAASECPSMSTTQGRLTPCSEVDDQAPSEVR